MREHPIPQDITGYKFHLIGSMTLKQFAEILLGVIVGLFFYKTNLPGFIKWPLVFSFVGLGFAAAFVPIEERPLDQWVVNFFKALFKPTKFNWKREPQIPDAFTYSPDQSNNIAPPPVDLSPARKQRIQDFLRSLNYPQENKDLFEQQQEAEIAAILQNFDQIQVNQAQSTKQIEKPNLKVRVRKMQNLNKKIGPTTLFDQNQTSAGNQASASFPPHAQNPNQAQNSKPAPKKAEPEKTQKQQQPAPTPQPPNNNQPAFNGSASSVSQNQDLPFPNKPTQPNRIVGMVLTQDNKLIEDAVIDIKNEQGKTITAVKSNALGQFFVSQTLPSGIYYIKGNHKNYEFKSQKLELTGKILDPLEIRAET
jgi:hypothetical protein